MIEVLSSIDWTKVFAVAGTAGASLMAYLKRREEQKKKAAEAELKMEKERLVTEKRTNEFLKENIYITKLRTLKQIFDLRTFASLEKLQNELFDKTSFDRLTVMFMMNGKVDFNFMSVIYDYPKDSPSGETPYRKVEINDEYRMLVSNLLSRPTWMTAEVAEKRLGELGEYIKMEGITYIGWFRVKRIALDDFNDLLVYLSWSTEEEKQPTNRDKRTIELLTNSRIIPMLQKILAVPDDADATELLDEIDTARKGN